MRRLNRAQLLGIALALVLASVALLYGRKPPMPSKACAPDAGRLSEPLMGTGSQQHSEQ
jgi:hypothetical protein